MEFSQTNWLSFPGELEITVAAEVGTETGGATETGVALHPVEDRETDTTGTKTGAGEDAVGGN